jgi:hypothetical protein
VEQLLFEEVGVAEFDSVLIVTSALAGKRYRATVGGEWRTASFVVDRLVRAAKCRAADDLLLVADSHPVYKNARAQLANKAGPDLVRIPECFVRAMARRASDQGKGACRAVFGTKVRRFSLSQLKSGLTSAPLWPHALQTNMLSRSDRAAFRRSGRKRRPSS